MPTLHAQQNPKSRTDVGNAILAAAKLADVAPVKKRLAGFAALHKEFLAADGKVDAADAAVRAQQATVAALDVEQDAALEALAVACVADGAPRTKPFGALGFPPPSEIARQADLTEAKTVRALATKARKAKGASKATLAACARAEKASVAVEKAAAPLGKLRAARQEAVLVRDKIGQRWEKALGVLKRAARTADDDGAGGLFAALFSVAAPRRSHTRVKRAKGAPSGAGAAAPPSVTAASGG